MKIAYVGDFLNHGKSLQTIGTSIVLLLSDLSEVDSIDVYCPSKNENVENFKTHEKIKLIESYKYDNLKSILNLLKIRKKNYDKIIFNLLPTGFGKSSLSNFAGLSLPIILKDIFGDNRVEVIYHNSVFTNDIKKLGYNSLFDRFRAFILSHVERTIFRSIQTFVFLQLYKDRIGIKIKSNKVSVLKGNYLEAITTVYINDAQKITHLSRKSKSDIPTILMHGSWGPQKNLELGLSSLRELKEEGIRFNLIISGGINHHFPEYEVEFKHLISSYSDIINKYLGIVDEGKIMDIFLEADLIILPYNTPGGHSGVLEQAIFFEVPTVAIDFPEYREQSKNVNFVKLTTKENFKLTLKEAIINSHNRDPVSVSKKIEEARKNIKILICEG